jgi:hypothetical protein
MPHSPIPIKTSDFSLSFSRSIPEHFLSRSECLFCHIDNGYEIVMAHSKKCMKKLTLCAALSFLFLLFHGSCFAQVDVLTQHNDLNRTGWNNAETILNQSNVTPTTFGILYQYNVDDQIYAQPLVVSGVMVGGVPKNIVYVATVNNTVYAFDADDGSTDPYWTRNFTPSGKVVPNKQDVHAYMCSGYEDFSGNFGIVGTPVIDKSTNTIYFVTRYRDATIDIGGPFPNDQDWSSTGFYQQFHALDLSTGADKFGSPVPINSGNTFVNGTGDGSVGGQIHFDPRRENQREGLVLSNGIIYITYAGHCDMNYYHGWILGYKANDLSQQQVKLVTTPNGGRGGTWMSGAAPAVDASGNLFFATGNGEAGSVRDEPDNLAMSVIKASPDLTNKTLKPISWFKPNEPNYTTYTDADLDFGTGVLLVPNMDMLVTAHKSGLLFAIKQNAGTGEFDESSSNIIQSINLGKVNSHSSITYFGGATTSYIYQYSENTNLQAYPIVAGPKLGTPISSTVPGQHTATWGGGFMSVSSKGTDESTAILWVTHITGADDRDGILHALKANDVKTKLWSSDDNPADRLGLFAKMTCVTVANGKVYAPTFSNNLKVYGLLSSSSRCTENVAKGKAATATSYSDASVGPEKAVDGDQGTRWAVGAAPSVAEPQDLQVDLGNRFNICKINLAWNQLNDLGVDFTIDVSEDGSTWTNLHTVTGNSFTEAPLVNEYNEHASGRYLRVNITKGTGGFASIIEFSVYGVPANSCIPPTDLSVPAGSITQTAAKLTWKGVAGVNNYRVRYRANVVSSYITRTVSDPTGTGGSLSLNVGPLSCGTGYNYTVESDCGGGTFSDAVADAFTTADCSTVCVDKTRFNHADLGDIQMTGNSCFTDSTATVTGAGSGINGNADQFQYNFTAMDADGEFIAHLADQDAVPPNSNQAGIMIRDSVTDISRFIFIGKSGDNKLYLLFRNTVGGPVTSSSVTYLTGNDYFRLVKVGTQYSAFYGPSYGGPWTAMGTTHDLSFGTNTVYQGYAVSSRNPAVTSTALFRQMTDDSAPLPIELLNFTAKSVQNEYVNLRWQTTMEENNDHFDIERSTDGVNFVKIATVKAVGFSSTLQTYTQVDNHPAKGFNYYRLKQVDSDGHSSISKVVMVKFGNDLSPVVHPNPIHSDFTVMAGSDPIKEVVIYNIQGKAISYLLNSSGSDDLNANAGNMAPGIYILKVKTDKNIYQIRVVKE